VEDLEARLAKLEADNEALSAKNKELITEKRKLQSKVGEIDFDAYNKAMEENDNLKGQVSKLNNDLGLKSKEVEKLSTTLNELDTNLKTTKLENTLNEELSKLGLKPTSLRLVKAALKAESKFGEDGSVLIGDKPVNDYLKEWSATEEAKDAMIPTGNSGSGASGGNTQNPSTQKRSEMNHQQKGEFIKANGQDAYLKLPN
jgi:predicted nuclease with TOPRIM domain